MIKFHSLLSNTFNKAVLFTILLSGSFYSFSTTGEAKPFDCVDKKTFEVKAECLSNNIENNLEFKNAEKTVFKNASEASDRALASMTFDSRTMTIKIVAHRDATIAKVDTSKVK